MSLKDLFKTFEDEVKIEVTPDLKFIKKDSDGISLKGVLQRERAKFLRNKTAGRQGKTFSPSTMTYSFCRRLKVAQLADKTEIFYDKHPPRIQTNFDIGNALHEMVQGYFWDVGILKGTFECVVCKDAGNPYIFDNLVSPKRCPGGHSRDCMKFNEIKVKDSYFKLSGRLDGVVVVEDEDHIFDIKSIASRSIKTPEQQFCYEDLDKNGPKPEHLIQLTFYMYMSNIHKGHLLYINKNDGKIKTFSIPYNYDLISPYLKEIEKLINIAEAYKHGALDPGELPVPCGRKDCPCEKF